MWAEIGDKVITGTGFNYVVMVVSDRTRNTIATKHLNGSPRDLRANPHHFRAYDKAKVNRLLQIDQEIEERKQEQRDLYQSLETID